MNILFVYLISSFSPGASVEKMAPVGLLVIQVWERSYFLRFVILITNMEGDNLNNGVESQYHDVYYMT